ncbi:metallophosphoesterase [Chromatiaceae bacterium AAb-1]|nr:metallophosphoesterase [Chromatiaceae bacterium AAb-1]
MRLHCCLLFIVLAVAGCSGADKPQPRHQLAFLADVHLHDIHAWQHTDSKPADTPVFLRSMSAQLNSTRLFNEQYFAFLTTLTRLAEQNVKLVILPGDFTDDGQPANLLALQRILQQFEQQHGMRFFLAPGNHDPVRPWRIAGGKQDYLDKTGREYGAYSHDHPACQQHSSAQQYVYCDDAVGFAGYAEIQQILGAFGFNARPDYHYFETPFSRYDTAGYSLTAAVSASAADKRHYSLCIRQQHCMTQPDLSYLAEPEPGLWLLSIDANVYLPRSDELTADNLQGSSDAGYNAVVKYKPFLVEWIRDVVARAKAQNKTLIAFSHFPMTGFYDNADSLLAQFAGRDTFQQHRLPQPATVAALAATGLTLHFGGHMHINDTGVYRNGQQHIINVQVPSLAAYPPAYKLLDIYAPDNMAVRTVTVEQVPQFDQLFPYYQQEWQYLSQHQPQRLWDTSILAAQNYYEFAREHLAGVARQRYIPGEWPAEQQALLSSTTGEQLLALCSSDSGLIAAEDKTVWQQWTAQDLLIDYYRLANADELARERDISATRLQQYLLLASHCTYPEQQKAETFRDKIAVLLQVIVRYSQSQPAINFHIDPVNGKLTRL